MTTAQLKTLHTMFSRLKKLRPEIYDDAWLRLCVRNAGQVKPDCTGHVSTKSLTNVGLENVLAIIEQELERGGEQPGEYWRDTVSRRRGFATRRQLHAIAELAPQVPYPLEKLCLKFSDGRNALPEKLTPGQAQKLIEMMKEVAARSARKMPAGVEEGGTSTGETAGSKAECITVPSKEQDDSSH